MSVRERLARFRQTHQGSAESRVPGPAGYSGSPDLPLQDPGFMDPMNYIPVPGAQTRLGLAAGRAMSPVVDVTGAGMRAAGDILGPAARRVGGAVGGAISHLPIIGGPIRGAVRGWQNAVPRAAAAAAPEVAPLARATAAEMKPLIGAEGQAFEQGGMAAVEEMRAAKAALRAEGKVLVPEHVRSAPKPRAVPKLKVVEGKPKLGSAESRVPKASRHEVQYFSESQGKFVSIEKMPISHLRNAMNKLQAKLSATKHPSPVTRKQFEAIKAEVTHRAQQAGELTVPGPTKAGSAASRVAAKAPRRVSGPAFEKPGQTQAELEMSVKVEQFLAERGITDPAQKAQVYQEARKLMGGAR